MKLTSLKRERGSVIVLAAFAMFPAMFLMAFAIDISHWYDYSRNLQNRADAAALAAAGEFGSTCIGAGDPGATTNGAQSALGKWAQLYSGAGLNETAGNLPYTDAAVSAATTAPAGTGTGPGTGWNLATNGYINNTRPGSTFASPLTLKAGSLNDYWLVLNGKDYAENGGTSFTMNAAGTGATFCNSDPTQDLTDPSRATAGPAGPMVDVKVSQRHLPLFFQGLFPGLHPNIHAHARVQLQGESSSPSEPIAVSDGGFAPCVSVKFVNANTNAVMYTAVLTKQAPVNPTDPVTWSNPTVAVDSSGNPIPGTGPAPITMPASAHVYLQPFLNDCSGSGNLYDGDTNTGLLLVNNHPATDPTVTSDQPPKLTTGGVNVSGSCAPATQYLSIGGCTVSINANVRFASDVTPTSKRLVFAIDHTWDNVNNQWVTSAPIKLPNAGGDLYSGNLAVGDQSGIHQLEITWEEDEGTVGGASCKSNPTPAACMGTFGIQAQTFGACNGCDQPDDSGPIIFARISEGASNDVNSLAASSGPHNLVVTLKLAGLFSAQPNDPPTILRFPTSSNHQTGLADCGQGSGTNADAYVVYYGCGPANPRFTSPPLNPLFINERNGDCSNPPWPSGNHQDCVQTTPGTRRTGIICPLVLRVVGAPFGTTCNNNSVGTCPVNYWKTFNGSPPNSSDPRALTMIITSAADFASAAGSPQAWIPIRRFATFYITGWDSGIQPQCPTNGQFVGNDPFPVKGKQNSDNGAVWGHWTNWVDVLGTGNNQTCPTNSPQPVNCVPVLTR
jgi:Flp pilus assembly protein TadG